MAQNNLSPIVYNKEFFFIFLISIILFVITCNFFYVSFYSSAGDSAGFVDIISSVHEGKGMVSSAFSSIYSLMPYLTYNLEQYSQANFESLYYNQDFSQWHAYLIVYIMSLFKYLGFTSLQIACLFMSLTIVGSLVALYIFLRINKINILYSLLFIISIIYYIPFIGNIFGQFYYDRLFIFFELILLILLFQKFNSNSNVNKYIIVIFFFTISISERPAIFASLTIIYFLIFYFKKFTFKKDWYLIILPILGFLYTILYMKFILNSPYYSKITLTSIIANLSESFDFNTIIGQKTEILLLMVLPMLIISMFNYRFIILAFFSIIPNLIISVGGAEKIGFTTHYHAMYIPFILFTTSVGLITIYNTFSCSKKNIIILLSILSIYSTYYIKLLNLEGKIYIIELDIKNILPTSNTMIGFNNKKLFYNQLVSNLPHDAKISTIEWTMPILVEHGMKRIDYLPIGLDKNEFLLVEYIGLENTTLPSIPSYLIDNEEKEKNARYIQSLIDKNYKTFKTTQYNGITYVIYERRG